MKRLLAILMICILSLMACATNNKNEKSLSSSHDGIWKGYTDLPEGRFEISMEIKNGVMTGLFEDTKIKGYLKADNDLHISPFSHMGAQVILDTNFMSPDRIGGIIIAVSYRHMWFVEKK